MSISVSAGGPTYPAAERVRDAQHVTIYYNPGYFAAWPFNFGLWAFRDDEVLVSFMRSPCRYAVPYDVQHRILDQRRALYVTLRSRDGGATWPLEGLQVVADRQELERQVLGGSAPASPATAPDWTSPDFCFTGGFGILHARAQEYVVPLSIDPFNNVSEPNVGYLQYSRDRGQSWEGPFRVPQLGFSSVQVRPDYLVRPDGLVLMFVTVTRAPRADGRLGRQYAAIYASPDSGLSWHYLASIQPTWAEFEMVTRFCPCPLLLPDGRILAVIRCQIDAVNAWPELYESCDGGLTWQFVGRPTEWGGPSHLSQLDDGRLLLVYGYRVRPFGVRARISKDDGRTWGRELILRDDGGSYDVGYPRAVKLSGGRVLVAYYFNRADDQVQCNGGVRHIAATIFTP